MYGKGIFEIEAGRRGFKFGAHAAGITQQATGKKIGEIMHGMFEAHPIDDGNGGTKLSFKEGPNTIAYLLAYFYGGACSYADLKKVEAPTQSEVGDWIEEMGFDKAMDIYNESLKGPNSESPAKATPGSN